MIHSHAVSPRLAIMLDERRKRRKGRRRGKSTTARGYGYGHQKMRRKYASLVASGRALCSRCGELIEPGTPWDLDHDNSRLFYLGPSHVRCNRATNVRVTSRDW